MDKIREQVEGKRSALIRCVASAVFFSLLPPSSFVLHPSVLLADGPPEIFAVSPNEGAAGDTVQIKGRGFRGTIRVIFAVGRTNKDAPFSVVSDKELSVTVPDYYLPDLPATVAVLTPHGVTVGIPASAIRVDGKTRNPPKTGFFHVAREGMVDTAMGTTLICFRSGHRRIESRTDHPGH